jgi:thiol-disulfide isomerase/thioredoxin
MILKIRLATFPFVFLLGWSCAGPARVYGQTHKKNAMAEKPIRMMVEDQNGGVVDVGRQKGKVLFINFWSLSCIPCKQEMPAIDALYAHFRQDTNFRVLAIDLDRNLKEDLRYFDEKHYTLPVYKLAGVVPDGIFHGVLPTTAVIDKSGKVVYLREEEGRYDTDSFRVMISALLTQ